MQTKTRKTSINGPRNFYKAIKLIWAVKNTKTQIQIFEKLSLQASNITQCENHRFSQVTLEQGAKTLH
jgi:hypothetical protein